MLQELRTLGYDVTNNGGKLKVGGPPIPEDLRVRIQGNKRLILNELAEERGLLVLVQELTDDEAKIEYLASALWNASRPDYEQTKREYEALDEDTKAAVIAGFDQMTGIRTPADFYFILECDRVKDNMREFATEIVRSEDAET